MEQQAQRVMLHVNGFPEGLSHRYSFVMSAIQCLGIERLPENLPQ